MYLGLNVRREVLFLFLHIIICNLTQINTGAAMGYSSVVLPVLTSNMSSITINEMEVPLFASIVSITQIIGCLLCLITMNYGRRCTMIVCGINFSLGWILIANVYTLIRLKMVCKFSGIAMGLSSSSIEIYLAEISITSWREIITTTPNTSLSVGVLVVYCLGFVAQNNWRLIAVFFIILSILFLLCNIFFIRESPEWLLLKNRKEAARISLLRIRGLHQETIEFQKEFAEMRNCNKMANNSEMPRNCQPNVVLNIEAEKGSSLSWNMRNKLKRIQRITLLPEVWKPFVILNLYFFWQQFSGLYVIITYAVDMIRRIDITIDPFFITVIVGVVQLVGNMVTTFCSMRLGRRTISIISGIGVSISLSALTMYLQFFENTGVAVVPLVCILSYVGFGSFGFLMVPWSMIGELYPTKYINVLGSLTTTIANSYNCIIIQLYPMMVTQNRNATFYFYCIISIIGTFFVMMALPETRGKTRTQIEETFKKKLEIVETVETFRKIEDVY
ncbi:PREDICTED: facilitated trehalose transporter Tret1-like [Trachymyrmex septentrionalis]|nr:PREDICTED: facilitated trehalose transporter Tret1-like [Trachymyrmex septentrionalis]